MKILGIETSCDETSASVVDDGAVLSNVISSQLVHALYGGVVPELASRAHLRLIVQVAGEAIAKAGIAQSEIDGVAATAGPGLAGALLVGLNFAKAFAFGLGVPFTGVNHMEGHLYSNFLTEKKPDYPFLTLIVSGGHTMLVHVTGRRVMRVLGQTRDDAAGEAFDKVAKMLGLGYPGGPVIDRMAEKGNAAAIAFPRSFLEKGTFDFSFSGVKTAVLYYLRDRKLGPSSGGAIPEDQCADICASFQRSVIDVLVGKTIDAAEMLGVRQVAIAGGVSANSSLRVRMAEECSLRGFDFFYPRLEYCMDNGAMIAYVGWMKLKDGLTSTMELAVRPNLALDEALS